MKAQIVKERKKISVVMSVYNAQSTEILRAAIDSIRNQTEPDWELIICDDGSTDDTWQKLRDMTQGDERIRLIHNKENRRAGHARNCCIREASGDYIAIMDADDLSHPDRLKLQKQFLDSHPEYAFVGTRGQFFIREVGDDPETYWFLAKPQAKDFRFSVPFVHASCMFRKEALEKVGGYDASPQKIRMEDYDMLLRLYAKKQYGANLEDTLYYIRRDEQQYKRRKYRYRFNEARMKYRGFRDLGLMPGAILYVIKPLIVGLIPWRISAILQKSYYRKKL